MQSVNMMLLGGIAVASGLVGIFFLRFWRSTRDRFFLFFATSFFIEGASRLYAGLAGTGIDLLVYYLIRLVAYLLILFAIMDKNLIRKKNQD